MKKHNWKHAPNDSDAQWICKECGKLDWNAIPDTDPTCSGSISQKIENEIKANQGREMEPKDIENEAVDLIASGYEWICPHCEELNNEIEITEIIQCDACHHLFRTGQANHAHK